MHFPGLGIRVQINSEQTTFQIQGPLIKDEYFHQLTISYSYSTKIVVYFDGRIFKTGVFNSTFVAGNSSQIPVVRIGGDLNTENNSETNDVFDIYEIILQYEELNEESLYQIMGIDINSLLLLRDFQLAITFQGELRFLEQKKINLEGFSNKVKLDGQNSYIMTDSDRMFSAEVVFTPPEDECLDMIFGENETLLESKTLKQLTIYIEIQLQQPKNGPILSLGDHDEWLLSLENNSLRLRSGLHPSCGAFKYSLPQYIFGKTVKLFIFSNWNQTPAVHINGAQLPLEKVSLFTYFNKNCPISCSYLSMNPFSIFLLFLFPIKEQRQACQTHNVSQRASIGKDSKQQYLSFLLKRIAVRCDPELSDPSNILSVLLENEGSTRFPTKIYVDDNIKLLTFSLFLFKIIL